MKLRPCATNARHFGTGTCSLSQLGLVPVLVAALACSGSKPTPTPPADGTPGAGGKPGNMMPSTPGSGGSPGPGPMTPPGTGGSGVKADAGVDPTPPADAGAPADMRGNNPGPGPGPGPAPVSDAGSPPAGPAGPWARGVTIGLVEVTQGVFIKIGEGGMVIDPAMRNAPLIEGRPLFVRAHVVAGQGFQARRLRGVLTIDYGGGNTKAVEDAKMVSGSSVLDRLDGTLNFLLPAADVKPGSSMSVAIYETAAAQGADPSPLPRFPANGVADLAIKAGRMVLDVVAMPVTGPMGALADTPANRQKVENDLYDLYPVQKVNVRYREPLKVTARLTSSSAGFTALRDARTADNAKPWEYYHLLVGRADCNFSFAGVASSADGSPGSASRRVAITVVGSRSVDGNTNTFAHELGHNHGRGHAPACGASGGAGFPYMNGDMGVNGFALSTLAIKPRTMWKELMGYCRPRWISDFTWKALEARVRIVSAFHGAAGTGAMALTERSLQGYAAPGETPNFGVVPGHLVEAGATATATRRARLTLVDGSTVDVPVSVQLLTDDVTREFAVNLPSADVVSAEITADGQTTTIDVSGL